MGQPSTECPIQVPSSLEWGQRMARGAAPRARLCASPLRGEFQKKHTLRAPQPCRSGPCSFGITSSLTLLCLGFSLAALPTRSRANGKEQVQRVKSEEGKAWPLISQEKTNVERKKSSTWVDQPSETCFLYFRNWTGTVLELPGQGEGPAA